MRRTMVIILVAFIMIFCCSCNRIHKADAAEDISLAESATTLTLQSYEKEKKPSTTDSAIAVLLQPHLDSAIEDYFGKRTQYALYDAKVDRISQVGTDFIFQIVITVPTFHGPHNPPYGLETMTFTIKSGGIVILDKYEHKDVKP